MANSPHSFCPLFSPCILSCLCSNHVRPDHAVRMIRFAQLILQDMSRKTKELEITLGPDTGDLALRVGVHSGPVTAGVLRGERARFQLFGDTMNVAARIEASGDPGRIHVSNDTAELLKKAGKEHWLVQRNSAIYAKGKGQMQTYWVKEFHSDSSSSSNEPLKANPQVKYLPRRPSMTEKESRLVDWNVEMLKEILVQIIRRRLALRASDKSVGKVKRINTKVSCSAKYREEFKPFECVQEIIALPEFEAEVEDLKESKIEVPTEVLSQLQQYVTAIASKYRKNSFHSFEVRICSYSQFSVSVLNNVSFTHPLVLLYTACKPCHHVSDQAAFQNCGSLPGNEAVGERPSRLQQRVRFHPLSGATP